MKELDEKVPKFYFHPLGAEFSPLSRLRLVSRGVPSAGVTSHKIRGESSSNGSEIAECRLHSAKNPS